MIGEKLGPYEIVEEIGRGGMAVVYRAFQPAVERFVAVKVIAQAITGDEAAALRFQREARLIARLEHPYVLPVYDFDGLHQPPYIVMRYLDAGTLREVMAKGLLPPPEVVFLLHQIGEALDYAHRQGIVHRDVKPSNVLIDAEGNAFVSDFGIARLVAEERRQKGSGDVATRTGAVIGTPHYMPPEQARGLADIDHRADVYALGVMSFEMFSGVLPYPADTPVEMMMLHIQAPVPGLREHRPEASPALDEALRRAMAKEPEERFQTVAAMVEAIADAVGDGGARTPAALRAAARESQQRVLERRAGRREQTELTLARFAAQRGETPGAAAGLSQLTPAMGKTAPRPGPDSKAAPSEAHKVVTVLAAAAADFAEVVEELEGTEAARRRVDAFWEAAAAAVGAHGGKVVQRSGENMVALWGVEAVSEDDTERALRAALDIRAELRRVGASSLGEDDDEPLPFGIGVNTGTVLLTPGEDGSDTVASGSTMTVATKLAQRGEGTILAAHGSYRQVQGIFTAHPDEAIRVRGRRGRLAVYRVDSAKPRAFRIGARGVEGVETAMVGREAELRHLENAYVDAIEEGETQVVTVLGEAGIGKSRLLTEFTAWAELRPEVFRIFQARAAAGSTQRPYALLRELVSFRFEILDSDDPATVRAKLEAGVAELTGAERPETAHLIGHLVGFDLSASPHVEGLLGEPEQLARSARRHLQRLFVETGARNPMVVEIEDLHFADDASLDALDELVAEQRELPLLVVCLARPALLERRPGWGDGQPFHTRLELRPLDRRGSRRLVREILAKVPQPPRALRDLLVEQAQGNPFFIEETVKMLIEDRVIVKGEDEWTVEESRLGALRVPPTLVGLLQARFDTLLYPEKLLLQRAAVVGRTFWDGALRALDAADEKHLDDLPATLGTLVERDFVFRRDNTAFAGQGEYVFAQNLMRDAVYQNLLRRQLELYHRATAEWLVEAAGERVDELLPEIAEHYELAGEGEAAGRFLARAGDKAWRLGASSAAKEALERAEELLPEDERTPVRILLGEVLIARGELAAARRPLEKALAAARQSGEADTEANALFQLSQAATAGGDYEGALGLLEEAMALARDGDDRLTLARVLYGLADTHFRSGRGEPARAACVEALEIATAVDDKAVRLAALNRLGSIELTFFSDVEAATGRFKECQELGQEVGDKTAVGKALANLGDIARKQGQEAIARAHTEEAVAIFRDLGTPLLLLICLHNLCQIHLESGELELARGSLAEALELARRAGSTAHAAAGAAMLVPLRLAEGAPREAARCWGLVASHPSATADSLDDIEPSVAALRRKISPEELEAEMSAGRGLDLHAVVDEFLASRG